MTLMQFSALAALVTAALVDHVMSSTCEAPDESAYMQLRAAASADHCAGDGQNCTHSKCCKHHNHQCFTKNKHWAACLHSCTPGMIHPHDPDGHKTPWECKLLSKDKCTGVGEDCSHSKCCKDPTFKCFKKNHHWATCMASCTPGMIHPHDPDGHKTPWECSVLSGHCAGDGEDCSKSHCCKRADAHCYKKNEHWAACMKTCTPGMIHPHDPDGHKTPWNCSILSDPGHWHPNCAAPGSENCMHKGCCKAPGETCYEKNRHWASCLPSCTPGMTPPWDHSDHKTPWSCKVLSGCVHENQDCRQSKCCKNPHHKCYEKNEHWAHCKSSCTPGINHHDPPGHRTPWSCNILTPW